MLIEDVVRVFPLVFSFRGRDLRSTVAFGDFWGSSYSVRVMSSIQAVCDPSVLFVRHIRLWGIVVRPIRHVRCDQAIGGDDVARRARLYVQGMDVARDGYVLSGLQGIEVDDQLAISNRDRCIKDESITFRLFWFLFRDRASFFTNQW